MKNTEYVSLPIDAIPALRRALAQGLHAISEVKRSQVAYRLAKSIGPIPNILEDACPLLCSAADDDMTKYAEALLWLDFAKEVEEQ